MGRSVDIANELAVYDTVSRDQFQPEAVFFFILTAEESTGSRNTQRGVAIPVSELNFLAQSQVLNLHNKALSYRNNSVGSRGIACRIGRVAVSRRGGGCRNSPGTVPYGVIILSVTGTLLVRRKEIVGPEPGGIVNNIFVQLIELLERHITRIRVTNQVITMYNISRDTGVG